MTIDDSTTTQSEYEHLCADYPQDGVEIRNILDRVGDKWSLLIIVSLERGPLRYGQLKRHVAGVSQRMLTLTLRHLERDGLIARTVHPQTPPRVDYELTALGRTLIPPARSLANWAIANYGTIEQARSLYDRGNSDKVPVTGPARSRAAGPLERHARHTDSRS